MQSNVIPDALDVRAVRKRPLDVQAVILNQDNLPQVHEWIIGNGHHAVLGNDQLIIQTLEGPFVCRFGDAVMRGIEGEFYRCDPSVYEKSYDDLGSASGDNS
jgi:hypothetical protein